MMSECLDGGEGTVIEYLEVRGILRQFLSGGVEQHGL